MAETTEALRDRILDAALIHVPFDGWSEATFAAARRDADAHADRLVAVAPRAVEEGRAFVVDGSSYFNRSGPRAVDGVEILAGLFHPDRSPAREHGAVVWRPG